MADAAASRSATSPSTTCGLLPPSSRLMPLTSVSPMSRRSDLPTVVEPVNAILSTPGWRASARPMTEPGPGTTLSTPGGMPASSASSPRRIADRGDWDAGFRTTVLPAASAAPDLPGRDDERVVPGHDRGDDADRLAGHERQRLRAGRPDLPVQLVDRLGVPLDDVRRLGGIHPRACRGSACRQSSASTSARYSRSPRMSSAKRRRSFLRSTGARSDQRPSSKAVRAATTARSTSSSPPSATSAIVVPSRPVTSA